MTRQQFARRVAEIEEQEHVPWPTAIEIAAAEQARQELAEGWASL